jgi:uncharacterized SAM-binding protein YcdF (DUF218 family)
MCGEVSPRTVSEPADLAAEFFAAGAEVPTITPMLTVLKMIGAPGSPGFLIVAGLLGVAIARTRRGAATIAGVLLGFYGVLAVPVVAIGLADALGPYDPQSIRAAESQLQGVTLVVLGGDNGSARDLEARRLAVALRPERVVVLGDPGIARTILETGVPGNRLIEDDGTAATTRDQIAYVWRLQRLASAGRIVVVASRLQMPRVVKLAQARAIDIVPAASDVDNRPPESGWRRWCPSIAALHVSRDAIYEHAALAYYGWRGWID